MKSLFIVCAFLLCLTECDKPANPVTIPETPPITFDFGKSVYKNLYSENLGEKGEVRQCFIDTYVQGGIELAPSWEKPFFFVIRPAGGHVIKTRYSDNEEENIRSGFYSAAYDSNDLGFNRTTSRSVEVWRDSFAQMHVHSDADWDKEHPAGTPLDDLLQINYLTVAPFVRGGYHLIPLPQYEEGGVVPVRYRIPVCGRLSEIGTMEMVLADKDIYVVFASAPTKAKTHTLTVEWTTTRGEVKAASIRCQPMAAI